MKKLFPFLILVILFSSCKMQDDAQSTPELAFSFFEHKHGAKVDTILAYPLRAGVYSLDTIYALDTMAFLIGANGRYNALDSLIIRWDTTSIKATFAVGQDWNNFLDPAKTDVAKGRFYFCPYVQRVVLPMLYVPQCAGTDTVVIHLANCSTAFGPVEYTFIQPVR
ncbi:MAG: hypothetical protein MJZ58_01900 [Paludibacteraceae bacterium]|nr:hypothetical protein [Paludibacteraceae bacterium]